MDAAFSNGYYTKSTMMFPANSLENALSRFRNQDNYSITSQRLTYKRWSGIIIFRISAASTIIPIQWPSTRRHLHFSFSTIIIWAPYPNCKKQRATPRTFPKRQVLHMSANL